MLRPEVMDFRPGGSGLAGVGLRIDSVIQRAVGGLMVAGEAEAAAEVPLGQVRLRKGVQTPQEVGGRLEAHDRAVCLPPEVGQVAVDETESGSEVIVDTGEERWNRAGLDLGLWGRLKL